MLDQLRKHSLYANLKKCRFHQDEVRFLGYIVCYQGIRMEEDESKPYVIGLNPSQYVISRSF